MSIIKSPRVKSPRGARFALLPLLVVVLVIYWPGLRGPLLLDDVPNLESLRILDTQGQLNFPNIMTERGGWLKRPVAMFSFYANWLSSGDDIWMLKLTNVLIHLMCGVLVFLFAKLLLQRIQSIAPDNVQILALCTSALWLLTPIQTSTVLYIIQRMAQLSMLFSLAGLCCYCTGRDRLERTPITGCLYIFCAFAVFWPLATLSKENGALLPLLLMTTEGYFYRRDRQSAVVKNVRVVLVLSVVLSAMFVLGYAVVNPQWITDAYPLRDFTLLERLLTEPRILIDYALNVLQIPWFSPLGFFHDDVVVSTSVIQPTQTLFALVFILGLFLLALLYRKSTWSPVLYGVLFFLFSHSLEAGVFPLELYFEHRNYLPSVGLMFALVVGLNQLGCSDTFKMPGNVLLLAILLSYTTLTVARVWIWSSWEGIVRIAATKHPDSVRAQAGMAIIHLLAGKPERASEYLQRERILADGRRDNAVNLKRIIGLCLAQQQVPKGGYTSLAAGKAFADDPATVSALRWLHTVMADHPCHNWIDAKELAAIVEAKVAPVSGPGRYSHNWELHFNTGQILRLLHRPAQSYREFKRAYRYAPDSRIEEIRELMMVTKP